MADPDDSAGTVGDTTGGVSETSDGSTAHSDPSLVEEHTTVRRTLSPSVQLVWAVRVLVGVAIIGVVALFGAREFGIDAQLVAAGVAALVVVGLVWVHLRYRIWSFRVREDALYLERGVITNVKTVAPHVRIQHVDTSRGPLERALGLSTLVVYTAGSRGADVSIPGLTTAEAADLQQRVKELAIAADGGDAL
jgi:membrane protein YdbS with pleckstrin-like domain